eukprot:SAG11_NODE_29693_length_308_cov_0.870813_1_plen_76_part_10
MIGAHAMVVAGVLTTCTKFSTHYWNSYRNVLNLVATFLDQVPVVTVPVLFIPGTTNYVLRYFSYIYFTKFVHNVKS